jgi:hypothetical protein
MIKYHNAANAKGGVIDINDVTQENRASMQFFCIGCDKEMEAVLGQKREHHFRHKDIGDCNSETYLHRLAKRVLKYKFDTQPQFSVKYYVLNECSKSEQCEYKQRHNWQDCSSVVLKTVNLKDFYDTCEEEVSYKGFRADLMLFHSERPDRKPTFLEVSVNHDCTQKKTDSKIRIVEIKVSNEIDVFREIIENEGELVPQAKTYHVNPVAAPPPVRFYNFKRKGDISHTLSRFYLTRNDNGIYQANLKTQAITCQNADSEHEENACFEITISEDRIPQKQYANLYSLGIALAHKRGLDIKNCILCAHYGRCTISQDVPVNHPAYPKPVLVRKSCAVRQLPAQQLEQLGLAYRCNKYQVYEYAVQKIINSFKNIPCWEWTIA